MKEGGPHSPGLQDFPLLRNAPAPHFRTGNPEGSRIKRHPRAVEIPALCGDVVERRIAFETRSLRRRHLSCGSAVAAAWAAKLSGYSGIEKSLSGVGALPFSLASATVLGFVAAYFANSDRFHALIRWMRISGETSYASEWYRAFAAELTWVVPHLKDGRRLYGYPHEWPSSPDRGHIAIEKPTWLDVPDGAEPKPEENVRELLIPVTSIAMVEFMVRKEDEQRKQPKK